MIHDKTTIINSETEIRRKVTDSFFRIEIFFRGQEYSFDRDQLPIKIGRSSDECQLTLDSGTVSRHHCSLLVQDNQIGLLDQSTNGTHIKIGRAESVLIKNSFYPLVSQGNISLGTPIEDNGDDLIYFRICPNRSKNS